MIESEWTFNINVLENEILANEFRFLFWIYSKRSVQLCL